jgi:hypothetical protein
MTRFSRRPVPALIEVLAAASTYGERFTPESNRAALPETLPALIAWLGRECAVTVWEVAYTA